MIGLRRHTVQVVDHDPAWAGLAAGAFRRNPDLRADYAELKHDLRTRSPDDRKSYTDAKRDFILGVLNG